MIKSATILRLLMLFLATLLWHPAIGGASTNFVLKGRIIDVGGNPVAGGEIFVYNTARTRRPADFISPKSDQGGSYRLEIPAGKYWIVARVRNGAKYGPLMTGGRHSGEAQEIEAAAGQELTLDFTVADVREMARNLRKADDDYKSVNGRILDKDGKPVRGAYVFARKDRDGTRLPDFISAWSGTDGSYTLRMPPGKYYLGASTTYPPKEGHDDTALYLESVTTDGTHDIRLESTGHTIEEGTPNATEND
jgi:hypothetical protein